MSTRTSATRYARALFEVAQKEADPTAVGANLNAVAAALRESQELTALLGNRSLPDAVRRNVVLAVAEKLGVAPPVAKLLGLLADRRRTELVPEIAEVYAARLLEHQNIVQADVTTAVPLPADALSRVEAGLRAATGKQITMKVSVDPALLGGVVARVGSTVYDGSIRTQLKKMRDQLVAQG
ncbi:MAG TPA: ATP synthase F1 subunit delta [Vicinamibacterales bacterium]|nr:ATP synthase F1 subunit delta [Vicinamibacterales bacterium]